MTPLKPAPWGAMLSTAAALICAVPTLVLPADSPNAPKVALLVAGAVVFTLGVVRVRTENTARPRTPPEEATRDSD